MSKDTSGGFSVSAAKALFEAVKKPEIRNTAIAAAKNPFVRQAARNVAQDEKARGAVLNAVKDPSGSNKMKAAFAVADANKSSGTTSAPPPPPHRGTSSSSTTTYGDHKTPGKLSGAHSAIRSQLENLHLGGGTSSYSSSSTATNTSQATSCSSPAPPPLPKHTKPTGSTYSAPTQTPTQKSYGSSVTNDPHGIAQYSYTAAQSDELSFNTGDTILLRKKVDDLWVYGENQRTGQTGIVPISYLQVIIALRDEPSYNGASSSGVGSMIHAIALYDYNSGQPGDLIFTANQSIQVTAKINDEWLEGEVNGRTGIFPANFVNCSRIFELPLKNPAPSSSSTTTYSNETVTAGYDYYSGVPSDLSFSQGDVITVVETIDADWIMGELNGRRGLVPKTFLVSPDGTPKKVSKGIAEISSNFSPKKGLAIADYHSEDPKHLYVTRGDNLLIVEDVDEYYYRGKLEAFKTLPAGIVPKNVVQLSK